MVTETSAPLRIRGHRTVHVEETWAYQKYPHRSMPTTLLFPLVPFLDRLALSRPIFLIRSIRMYHNIAPTPWVQCLMNRQDVPSAKCQHSVHAWKHTNLLRIRYQEPLDDNSIHKRAGVVRQKHLVQSRDSSQQLVASFVSRSEIREPTTC